VDCETLARLLASSESIAVATGTEDTVRTVSSELAGSALHGLAVCPTTLDTLLHFLQTYAFPPRLPNERADAGERRVLADSAKGCMAILVRSHPTLPLASEPDVTLSILARASVLLIKGEIAVPGLLSQRLSTLTAEAASTQLAVYTSLLLGSIDVNMDQEASRTLLALFPIIGRSASLCLRASADLLSIVEAGSDGAENLSAVFTVSRVALLAARSSVLTGDEVHEGGTPSIMASKEGEEVVESLWSRIWPDWYRLLALSVEPACVNTVSSLESSFVFVLGPQR
jgi:hypothetical protein